MAIAAGICPRESSAISRVARSVNPIAKEEKKKGIYL